MTYKLGFALLLLLTSFTWADTWRPVEGPLTTPWTDDVTPDNVWPQYPRPQMVRPDWINLNGIWDYTISSLEVEQPQRWAGEILVPFAVESDLSGVKKALKPDQKLWYHRTFRAPSLEEGERLLLHFGAVDWECHLWINEQEIGSHTGGYDPFSFDITAQLKTGQNDLLLSVWDPTNEGDQPRGKQVLKPGGCMYTAVSGIWQTVWLEVVPANYITSLKITPDIDDQQVDVTVNSHAAAQITIRVLDGGQCIAEAQGTSGHPISLYLSDVNLWSPDSPFLYDLQVALQQDGEALDTVESYFGMRKIEVALDDQGIQRLKLNNEVLFQYGPLDQGWWPDGLYTPATDEAMQYDITMTKAFGMNMARKHVKIESARWYYWCDRLGLLVWQDMPSGGASSNSESKANYRRELQAMIDALYHFPSIVMWVPFNEGWGQFDTTDIVQWIQNYDTTRPVNEASGWTNHGSGDISDMHRYPGPGMRAVEESRAVVLGEFGGLGMPVSGHTWQDEANWGYVSYDSADALTDAYVNLLTTMRPLIGQGLAAAVYTQTSDVEIEVNGLLTYDRKVTKLALDRCAEAAAKLYLPTPQVTPLVATSEQVGQRWLYTLRKPDSGWMTPDFVDDHWQEGVGGFGTDETPGVTVRTLWDTSDIWCRRTFVLDALPTEGQLALALHHDENAEVYLNGSLIQEVTGYVSNMIYFPLSDEERALLKRGTNLLAVHCHQTSGGQYIDAGLSLIREQDVDLEVRNFKDSEDIKP